jgi:glutamate/tyrosine decarboxylase-like PLP-dependent enzyme
VNDIWKGIDVAADDRSTDVALARAAKEAIAFRASVGVARHCPAVSYGQAIARFSTTLPDDGLPARDVIEDLVERASPGLASMVGPRFFGWVIGASHPVGVAADWLVSTWGQNTGSHAATPSAAAVEVAVAAWLLELMDLPRESSVGFTTGATMAGFACLAAARGEVLRRAGWDAEGKGLFGAPPVSVLVGADAHATIFAALQYLGFGQEHVRTVATDGLGRIVPDDFAQTLAECSGPTIAILQAGQINTGAFDPAEYLIPAAHACGAWVHVDGAFGLWARASPEQAHLARGFEHADSWSVDGHKWLQVPYDAGYAIVRHPEAHRRAMNILASYLPMTAEDERNPSHYVPELSRRARGFPAWAMIRHLGRAGIAEMVRRHCRIARRMAERLSSEDGVRVLNDVVLNQFIVRFGADRPSEEGDRLTRETIRQVQEDGVCFVEGADWRGQWVMRVSVISSATTEHDAERSVAAILEAWQTVREQPTPEMDAVVPG